MFSIRNSACVFAAAVLLVSQAVRAEDLVANHRLLDTFPAHVGVELIYQVSVTNTSKKDIQSAKLTLAAPQNGLALIKKDLNIGQLAVGKTVDVQWILTLQASDAEKFNSIGFEGEGVGPDGHKRLFKLTSVPAPAR